MVLLWSLVFVFPTFNLTLWTYPLLSLNTFAIGHWFQPTSFWHSNTTSPTQKFLFPFCHLLCVCRDWRNSFLQHDQNSFAICWTQCHLLWQYKSGLLKFSGGGITTLDLMVNMFDGGSGTSHVGSLIFSVVRGLEFKIPSALVTNVRSDSSSSDFLGQHCTGQNPTQCCLWGSSQHCTGNPVLYCLNTPKGYIVQVRTLCNVVLTTPDNSA